jgi:hypothetical protein
MGLGKDNPVMNAMHEQGVIGDKFFGMMLDYNRRGGWISFDASVEIQALILGHRRAGLWGRQHAEIFGDSLPISRPEQLGECTAPRRWSRNYLLTFCAQDWLVYRCSWLQWHHGAVGMA